MNYLVGCEFALTVVMLFWSHTQNMGVIAYPFIQGQVVWSAENQFTWMFYTSCSTATTAYIENIRLKIWKGKILKKEGSQKLYKIETQYEIFYTFWENQSFMSCYHMHCHIAVTYSPSSAKILVNNIWCQHKSGRRNRNRKHLCSSTNNH